MKYLIILTAISLALNVFLAFKLRRQEKAIGTIEPAVEKSTGTGQIYDNVYIGENVGFPITTGSYQFNTGATSNDMISKRYWKNPNEGLTTGECNSTFGKHTMEAGTKGDFPVNRIGFDTLNKQP